MYIKIGQDLHGTAGSPFYIAPEILGGGYNEAADGWSADLQFPPDPWEHVSSSAKDLITGMLCVNPSKRLTATKVLAHVRMMDLTHETQEPYADANHRSGQLDDIDTSFCPFVRNQEYNFRDRTPATIGSQEENSHLFTCKSSFSSFLVDQCASCSVSVNFSVGGCCESIGPELSSPFSSMSSFAFFSPSSSVEQSTRLFGFQTTELPSVDKGPSEPIIYKLGEERRTELWSGGGIGWLKSSSIHNRRNHIIGLGELDLIVTESYLLGVVQIFQMHNR